MLIERQLGYAASGISAAILFPAYSAMLENSEFTPGVAIMVAACIGGLGVFMGTGVALSYDKRSACLIRLLLWCGIAGALSWMSGSCALQATEQGSRLFYLTGSSLPLIAYLFVLLTQWSERLCKDD